MPRFAANLSMMFTEVDFLERFELAANAGFSAVEFLFPYEYDPNTLRALLDQYQLELVLFNTAPGDVSQGEWGICALPGREEEARTQIDLALEYACALNCEKVHIMAGVVLDQKNKNCYRQTFINNLRYAADLFQQYNINITLEALSPAIKPDYFYHSQYDVMAVLNEVNKDNIFLQFDFFHAQLVDGNISYMLKQWLHRIAHIQIASVPDRHEPVAGELNYVWLFSLLDQLGYKGWVGCEYHPETTTQKGLDWISAYQ